MALGNTSMARCDVAEDLLSIDKELSALSSNSYDKARQREKELKTREDELFAELFKSEELVVKFMQLVSSSNAGLSTRFMTRLRFEVSHEDRGNLKFLAESLVDAKEDGMAPSRTDKKIVFIYGSEVNLSDGLWRNAPDGRRFWVSNEFPDIILSPAEYHRYLKSAATIDN